MAAYMTFFSPTLTHCMLGNVSCFFFGRLLTFKRKLQKIISGVPSACQIVCVQIRPDISSENSCSYALSQLCSKTCVKQPLSKRLKIVFQDQLSLNAGQNYCRMHSAILSTFIKLPFVIKIFILSIFEWQFYTGFTVYRFLFCIFLSSCRCSPRPWPTTASQGTSMKSMAVKFLTADLCPDMIALLGFHMVYLMTRETLCYSGQEKKDYHYF